MTPDRPRSDLGIVRALSFVRLPLLRSFASSRRIYLQPGPDSSYLVEPPEFPVRAGLSRPSPSVLPSRSSDLKACSILHRPPADPLRPPLLLLLLLPRRLLYDRARPTSRDKSRSRRSPIVSAGLPRRYITSRTRRATRIGIEDVVVSLRLPPFLFLSASLFIHFFILMIFFSVVYFAWFLRYCFLIGGVSPSGILRFDVPMKLCSDRSGTSVEHVLKKCLRERGDYETECLSKKKCIIMSVSTRPVTLDCP